jgi:hypothetical protein
VTARTVRRAPAIAIVALLAAAFPRVATAQTIGPVTLSAGLGGGYQPRSTFGAIGPHVWGAAETVLDRRLRVRLDAAFHYFGFAGSRTTACPLTSSCAPPLTSPLEVTAISGTVVGRDSTGVRRWYWLAGLGAYSALGGRDGNSRLGLTGGIGRELGANRQYLVEARVHLPYDANSYDVIVPITFGWNFGHFSP